MHVLIIKMSSMGDILHLLPALTEAGTQYPNICFDWVTEESFAEIPQWHPLVNQVIPIALRRWRKAPWQALRSGEWRQFRKSLVAKQYDYVIDAQGLIKSAVITRMAKGLPCGLDHLSAREMLASIAYKRTASVQPEQHAVSRMRQLFASILEYTVPATPIDYGIANYPFDLKPETKNHFSPPTKDFILFFHGTTWQTKHWPITHWRTLLHKATQAGYIVLLPWGNAVEFDRATKLATTHSNVQVLTKLNLSELASLLRRASGAIAVDTGLGHLAAALNVRTLSIYGPTNPILTGTQGQHQRHLSASFDCAPCLRKSCSYLGTSSVQPACFSTTSPHQVWQQFQNLLIS